VDLFEFMGENFTRLRKAPSVSWGFRAERAPADAKALADKSAEALAKVDCFGAKLLAMTIPHPVIARL